MSNVTHTITFDKHTFTASKGELLLFSLLQENLYAQGEAHGRARGAFCGMGVCQECLVRLEDGTEKLACQTTVEEDMEIRYES